MTKSVLDGLREGLDSVLSLRDSMGLALGNVQLVTRAWSGPKIGDGDLTENRIKVFPSPSILDLSQDIRMVDSGSVKKGDLILKSISKNKYSRETLMNESDVLNIEHFYSVNDTLYKAVSIKEKQLTWSVHIRPQGGA